MGWEPVAVIEGGVVYYIRADHIGRPVFATNASGAKVWSVTYTPFGGVHTSSGLPIEARFPGQWYQAESGLHQNWMRDYDPTTGRYIEADPLGLVDGASVYRYVRGNPGRYVDPTGEQTYVCTRPLGQPPGDQGPIVAYHEYLCVGTGKNMICGSTSATGGAWNNGYSSPGTGYNENDYFDETSCRQDEDENSCLEQCIANELSKPERPWYAIGPHGTDCQEYSRSTLASCKKSCGL